MVPESSRPESPREVRKVVPRDSVDTAEVPPVPKLGASCDDLVPEELTEEEAAHWLRMLMRSRQMFGSGR